VIVIGGRRAVKGAAAQAAALFSRRAMRRDEGAPRERGGKAAPSSGPQRAASTVGGKI
jgi:hypothetical protein